MKPTEHRSVMAGRIDPRDSLDHFPSPPWSARALCELLQDRGLDLSQMDAWEPAAGEGHMAEPMRDYFRHVSATDIHDYGRDYPTHDFLGGGYEAFKPNAIITNPPFRLSEEFALAALERRPRIVALLVRTSWIEGAGRYMRLFRDQPPSILAQFSERVPMCKGRWDPQASTATAYCWVVWLTRGKPRMRTELTWFPPGTKERCSRREDAARFGVVADAPLLEGVS